MTVIEKSAPGQLTPAQDLIPEVRRRTRRRRFRTGLIALVVVAVVVAVASIAGATFGASRAPRSANATGRSGAVLTSTSLGKDTSVGDVQMLNSRDGYAVAFSYAASRSHFYLVSTADSARTWRIVSLIGGVGTATEYFSPSIDFVNAQMGYAFSVASNSVALTLDGGHSWRSLDIANNSPHVSSVVFVITGQLAVASSLRCNVAITPPENCSTSLSLFHLGDNSPFATRHIPTFAGDVRFVHLLAVIGSHDIFVAPQRGGPIAESTDAGVTWHSVNTPCPIEPTGGPGQAENPVQLAQFANGAWLLDCIVGVGMNHALNSLWSTSNHGVTWHELSYVGVTTGKGNLIGNTTGFTWSNDHRILYTMWTGAAGGVGYSTNGTSWHWTLQDSANGGAQEFLTPIGPEGILYSSPSDVLALTTNARQWRTVRAQPDVVALTPSGVNIMPASVAKKYHYRIL